MAEEDLEMSDEEDSDYRLDEHGEQRR